MKANGTVRTFEGRKLEGLKALKSVEALWCTITGNFNNLDYAGELPRIDLSACRSLMVFVNDEYTKVSVRLLADGIDASYALSRS